MNMTWIWPVWIVAIAVSFSGLEAYAIASKQTTLSRFVWDLTAAWPPLPFIAGFLAGFLVCHFWWGGSFTFKSITGL